VIVSVDRKMSVYDSYQYRLALNADEKQLIIYELKTSNP
jgi:hypothetical protein